LKRVVDGLDPINVFRDPAANVKLDLPIPWNRGFAWGYAADGSYMRGSATAGDFIPAAIENEIEDLYVAAAAKRK
jgi:hypothetical protein